MFLRRQRMLTYRNLRFCSATAKPTSESILDNIRAIDPYVRDIGLYIASAGTLLMGAAYYKNISEDNSLV
jgi:hypothetical protein